jgi:hypothetical protein
LIFGILLLLTAGQAQPPIPSPAVSGIAAVGRPVLITRPVAGRVVAVLSDVSIAAPIDGDVIVWGGDVRFERGGSVRGNLSIFGGGIHKVLAGPLPVSGSVSTPGSLLAFYLAEMHQPPWQLPDRAAMFLGLRLVSLSGWLAASLALLWVFGSPFARAAVATESGWSRALVAGACGVSALFLAAAAALALLPAGLSVPLVVLFGVFAVGAKIFGMAALFLLIGQKFRRNPAAAARPSALAFGFAALGAISLVPLVGPVIWSVASIVSVGIALSSRFGTPAYRIAVP